MYKKIVENILKFLYPMKCPFCGMISERGICEKCRKKFKTIQEPYCMKCGKPIQDEQQEYCYDCRKERHAYEWGRSMWIHTPPISDAIYAFKYQNKRIYGKIFAKEMALKYGEILKKEGIEMIIPIPLHRSRRRVRGYNQAEILAEYLSEYTGIPMRKDILKRVRKTTPQKKLNNKQRKRNINNVFEASKVESIQKVVLLDDIYTTGSTIDEAASVLHKIGIQKVYFLTVSIGQGY